MINSAEEPILQIFLTVLSLKRHLSENFPEISTDWRIEKFNLQMPCVTAQKLMLKVRTPCYYETGHFETFL